MLIIRKKYNQEKEDMHQYQATLNTEGYRGKLYDLTNAKMNKFL